MTLGLFLAASMEPRKSTILTSHYYVRISLILILSLSRLLCNLTLRYKHRLHFYRLKLKITIKPNFTRPYR